MFGTRIDILLAEMTSPNQHHRLAHQGVELRPEILSNESRWDKSCKKGTSDRSRFGSACTTTIAQGEKKKREKKIHFWGTGTCPKIYMTLYVKGISMSKFFFNEKNYPKIIQVSPPYLGLWAPMFSLSLYSRIHIEWKVCYLSFFSLWILHGTMNVIFRWKFVTLSLSIL